MVEVQGGGEGARRPVVDREGVKGGSRAISEGLAVLAPTRQREFGQWRAVDSASGQSRALARVGAKEISVEEDGEEEEECIGGWRGSVRREKGRRRSRLCERQPSPGKHIRQSTECLSRQSERVGTRRRVIYSLVFHAGAGG